MIKRSGRLFFDVGLERAKLIEKEAILVAGAHCDFVSLVWKGSMPCKLMGQSTGQGVTARARRKKKLFCGHLEDVAGKREREAQDTRNGSENRTEILFHLLASDEDRTHGFWSGVVRITSLNLKFNGSHFGLPPSSIHRMTGLGGNFPYAMTYAHGPHWTPLCSWCLVTHFLILFHG